MGGQICHQYSAGITFWVARFIDKLSIQCKLGEFNECLFVFPPIKLSLMEQIQTCVH
jgi:hypothetical protein